MNVIGIIAEYNPFHNGHIYQIETIRAKYPKARIVALMSGSFTQRGCPAILDKWQRASHAVLRGIDLVLELPAAFAVRSAQNFAHGGVSLLSRLGVVDGLAFGAESPLALLQCAADSAKRSDVQELLHAYVQEGHSYAAALSHAIAQSSGINEAFLKQPNNILALEYLRALNCCAASIEPFAVARIGAAYHDEELHDTYASASSIRREIQTAAPRRNLLAKVLPANSMEALFEAHTEEAIPEINLLFRPLLAQLEHYTLENLQEIYGINEGFENRLLHAASHCLTMKDLLDECRSRRHPQSRIQRLIFHIMLHLRRQDIHEFDENGPLYARILAFNRAGKSLLHEIKQRSSLPLISKTSHFLKDAALKYPPEKRTTLENMLALDIHATEMRRLCLPQITKRGEDFQRSPLFISDKRKTPA